MTQIKRLQAAHISTQQFKELHLSLLNIMSAMNRPERDEYLVRAAGISLERALFALLISDRLRARWRGACRSRTLIRRRALRDLRLAR